MKRKKRKKKSRAGRLLAVLLACALVVCCVYLVTDRLVQEARRRLSASEIVLIDPTAVPVDEPKEDAMAGPAEEPLADEAVVIEADPMSRPDSAPAVISIITTAIAESEDTLHVIIGEPVQMPLTGLIIGIDPGHQLHGNNEQEPVAPGSRETKAKVATGTSGIATGTPEYAVNLDIALKLRDRLESLGAEVVMTRTTNDVDISNIERAQMCNEAGADIVLRLHCNGATNQQANGIGLYVTETGPIAQASFEAAELLLPAMARATGARPAGIFRRDTYSGLNWSTVPSILVEMGYMTNYEEDLKLEDPAYQDLLVDGMTRGLAEIFGRSIDEMGE